MSFHIKSEILGPLLLGAAGFVLFFSYALLPLAVALFCASICMMIYSLWQAFVRVLRWNTREIMLALVFVLFAASHAVGIFLPETGFDALWYHLPITQLLIHLRGSVFVPELYQSAMPHLGSNIFVVPYLTAAEFGVKLLCYIVVLTLPLYLYRIARIYLPRMYALLCCVLFFGFHTVGWQASSAYVDQLRTMFELAAVALLLQKEQMKSWYTRVAVGLLLGFALSTKLAVLFFLPAFCVLCWAKLGGKKAMVCTGIALAVAALWYIRAFMWTGNPVFPLFEIALGSAQMSEMGYGSWTEWITSALGKTALLPLYLTAHNESFTSLLFAFSTPYLLLSYRSIKQKLAPISLFVLVGFAGWFCIPRLSVRYGLTFFAVALVICIYAITQHTRSNLRMRRIFWGVIALSLCVSAALRIGANVKGIPALLGKQSAAEYILQQTPGISRGPAEHWYGGYWKTWAPPQVKTRP